MKKRPEPITCPNCGGVYGVALGRCLHCYWKEEGSSWGYKEVNCWDHDWYAVSGDGKPMLAKQEKGDRFWHYVCQKCGAEYSKTREEWEEEPPPPRPGKRIPPSDSLTEMTVTIQFFPPPKELKKRLVEEAGGWEAYASEIRTYYGMILQPSEETKRLWYKVRRATGESALLRAAQKWLEGLAKDSERVVREYLEQLSFEKGSSAERWRQMVLKKSGLVKPSVPDLVEVSDSSSLTGYYSPVSPSGKPQIEVLISGSLADLLWSRSTRSEYEIRRTILHETLHWLDSLADLPWRENHGLPWEERLRKFKRMFPP